MQITFTIFILSFWAGCVLAAIAILFDVHMIGNDRKISSWINVFCATKNGKDNFGSWIDKNEWKGRMLQKRIVTIRKVNDPKNKLNYNEYFYLYLTSQ